MSLIRSLSVVVLGTITTVSAVADDKLDPAKIKDKVTISLGKKLVVRFEQKADALANPKIVKAEAKNSPTPVFSFAKLNENLALTTKNPYSRDLKFRALARLKNRKDYFETSIVPVKSGLFGIELWQDPIEELVLFDFKLVD